MKKVIFTLMALTTAVSGICSDPNNPLLIQHDTPHGTPVFTQIRTEHYIPAFEAGIAQAKSELEAIINNPEAPTFENTIEALERNGQLLNHVSTLFFVLNESCTSQEMEQIAAQVIPSLTELSNDISLNPDLFARVKTVYDQRNDLDLDTEQQTLLERKYKGFARSGAGLNDEDKERYRAITKELSELSLRFSQNVLAATNAFSLNIPLEDSAKVIYMPDFVVKGMEAEAKERGQEGWTVTLQQPSLAPFMTYSKESDLKEVLWRHANSLCLGGEFDNSQAVKRVAELRLELANLLGYPTYADYVLEERMAKDKHTVESFLNELLVSTLEIGRQEVNEVRDYAVANGGPEELMPWDFSYYSEKYRNEKYDMNEELLKPYFQLENVEKGVFTLAEKLYGITFKTNDAIEVYHPDVKAFEVYDENNEFISVLYMDYFPRASKRPGAWMTNFRDAETTADGEVVTPLVTLNFNFTKPTEDAPSLLTFNELTIFLHEFGHGLHGVFGKGKYPSLTGTSVFRDFVELPSQLMENWAPEKEFLDLWAVHYQTGERMPEELIQKIIDSKNYLAAYSNVRQVAFAMNDMAWHSITQPVDIDVEKFEKQATARAALMPVIEGTAMAPAFSHIFAGGYAAGYYSYKWAEVLEADTFSYFEQEGIFNTEVADSFRRNILEKGGSEHPMVLYVRFRGHEPSTEALIKKIIDGRE